MRITTDNIRFVKEHMGKDHNPESTFAVLLENGNERELRHYNLYTLPKAAKGFCKSHEYEAWYTHNPDLLTYVWMKK